MRRLSASLATLLLSALLGVGAACSGASAGTPAGDAGSTPLVDGGGCGAACTPPDGGGECLVQGEGCNDAGVGVHCCLGLTCASDTCQLLPSPCPNGEQLLPSGCGCDPSLGEPGGCAGDLVCDADLHCVPPDAGLPSLLVGQAVGAPCDPLASYLDGGPAPPCAQPDGGGAVDCVPDPSGIYLYVCAQACSSNADCPLAWQACNSSFAAPGHCGDALCTGFPATPSEEAKGFFAACPDGAGLCLPFGVTMSASPTNQVASYGLCLQASDAGPNATCSDPPTRGGPLCDAAQLCVIGRCRNPCNAALGPSPDAGCPASEVCAPLDVQQPVPGALYAAGGCVYPCELLDGGACDAGVDAGPKEAGDGGERDGGR